MNSNTKILTEDTIDMTMYEGGAEEGVPKLPKGRAFSLWYGGGTNLLKQVTFSDMKNELGKKGEK